MRDAVSIVQRVSIAGINFYYRWCCPNDESKFHHAELTSNSRLADKWRVPAGPIGITIKISNETHSLMLTPTYRVKAGSSKYLT